MLLRASVRSSHTQASLVDHVMYSPNATLYIGGAAIRGGEGWTGALTLEALDDLLFGPKQMLALHIVDPFLPVPVSPLEAAWTVGARTEAARASGGAGLFLPRTVRPAGPPPAPAHVDAMRQGFQR